MKQTTHLFLIAGLILLGLWFWFVASGDIWNLPTALYGSVCWLLSVWLGIGFIRRYPQWLSSSFTYKEASAWIAWFFTLLITLYLLLKTSALIGEQGIQLEQAKAVGRQIVQIIAFWLLLQWLLHSLRRKEVLEDERDRAINNTANQWAYGALVFCSIGMAVMLGLSPTEKLLWAVPSMIAHMLIFNLLWSSVVAYSVTIFLYWRDRR